MSFYANVGHLTSLDINISENAKNSKYNPSSPKCIFSMQDYTSLYIPQICFWVVLSYILVLLKDGIGRNFEDLN